MDFNSPFPLSEKLYNKQVSKQYRVFTRRVNTFATLLINKSVNSSRKHPVCFIGNVFIWCLHKFFFFSDVIYVSLVSFQIKQRGFCSPIPMHPRTTIHTSELSQTFVTTLELRRYVLFMGNWVFSIEYYVSLLSTLSLFTQGYRR